MFLHILLGFCIGVVIVLVVFGVYCVLQEAQEGDPSMPRIRKSGGCCGIYEMHQFTGVTPTSEHIERIIKSCKRGAYPGNSLPLVIQFADRHQDKHPAWAPYGSYGDQWMAFLQDKGYRVDKIKLGLNRKSGSQLELFLWFVHKDDYKIGLVREYNYEKQEKSQDSVGKLGTAKGKRTRRIFGKRS